MTPVRWMRRWDVAAHRGHAPGQGVPALSRRRLALPPAAARASLSAGELSCCLGGAAEAQPGLSARCLGAGLVQQQKSLVGLVS